MTTQTQQKVFDRAAVKQGSGPPRGAYVAPVLDPNSRNKKVVIGERLTGLENPLPIDPHNQTRYLRKGYKIATAEDIARLAPLDGRMRYFDTPTDGVDEVSMSRARIALLESQLAAAEQELAVKQEGDRAHQARLENLAKGRQLVAERKAATAEKGA